MKTKEGDTKSLDLLVGLVGRGPSCRSPHLTLAQLKTGAAWLIAESCFCTDEPRMSMKTKERCGKSLDQLAGRSGEEHGVGQAHLTPPELRTGTAWLIAESWLLMTAIERTKRECL